jgi:CBS domain-containing protein
MAMEIELIEIQQFLAQHPPFSGLPDEILAGVSSQLQVSYLRRDHLLEAEDGRFHMVRTGALELCHGDDQICAQLAEGGIHASHCTLFNPEQRYRVRAIEDTLLYTGDCQLLYRLAQTHPDFGQYFTAPLRERLQQALAQRREQGRLLLSDLPVRELIQRPAVCLEACADIRMAAQYMTDHGVSSLLITRDGDLAGILTDRDLRQRCLAAGLPYDTLVEQIMSPDPHRIEADTPLSEALLDMARLGIHHLPVTEGERLLGLLTTTDVVLRQGGNAALLASSIGKAESLAELVEGSRRIPALHRQLFHAGATAAQIGETLSHMTDAITVRLLQLAEAELGPPPVPYVWMAGGSQGRHEQSSHSDQDNALLLDDGFDPARHGDYFAQLARHVSDGLNACGFVYCPGDAMATNPDWRQPLRAWLAHYHRWIDTPEPKALMLASIFFDLRPVHGESALFERMQTQVLEAASKSQLFLAYMVANALTHRPPLGFFRQFVLIHDGQHDATLDLKHNGIVPIVDIARNLALSARIPAVNTHRRLAAAADAGILSAEMAANLQDALELIAGLRMQHQARQIEQQQAADNFLDPSTLSSLERDHLKDAFRVIQTEQEVLARRFNANVLG